MADYHIDVKELYLSQQHVKHVESIQGTILLYDKKILSVVQDTRSCLVTVTNEHQFISSSSSFSDTSPVSSCGTKSHPWHLEAPVGQRINISLLDFSDHVNAPTGRDVRCRQYGYILEKPNKKNASICAAAETRETKHREMAVFMSDTNTLDIVLVAGAKVDNHSFLIKLEGLSRFTIREHETLVTLYYITSSSFVSKY